MTLWILVPVQLRRVSPAHLETFSVGASDNSERVSTSPGAPKFRGLRWELMGIIVIAIMTYYYYYRVYIYNDHKWLVYISYKLLL